MRIFRQTGPGDWNSVVNEVLAAGTAFLEAFATEPYISKIRCEEWRESAFVLLRDCAFKAHRAGERDTAIKFYRYAQACDSQDASCQHYFGVALSELGRYTEALPILERACKLDERDAGIPCHLGNCLQALGRNDAALEAYDQALIILPSFDGHYNRGIVLLKLERADEALASLKIAAALRPDSAETYSSIGIAERSTGNFNAALSAYRTALILNPLLYEARLSLAALLLSLGYLQEALTITEFAVLLKPRLRPGLRLKASLLASLQSPREVDNSSPLAPLASETFRNKRPCR